jgi:hypothetical protein
MPVLKRVSPFVDDIDDSRYQEVLLEYEDVPASDKDDKSKDQLKEVDLSDDNDELQCDENILN